MTARAPCLLLWDPSCPHVDLAPRRLGEAFAAVGGAELGGWEERRCDDPSLPRSLRGYASPTILVAGRDGAGAGPTSGEGRRIDARRGDEAPCAGAPSVATIVAASPAGRDPQGRGSGRDSAGESGEAGEADEAGPDEGGVLVLVRHGETVGNSSIRLYGATDIDLSPLGEAQLACAGAALAEERFDRFITSPMLRARRSAAIVAAALRSPPATPIREVEALRERNFGDWEGWTVAEVEERDPAGYARWRSEGLDFCFPGGDARRDLASRVIAAVRDGGDGRPLFPSAARTLAVLHKGIIKVILGELLGLGHAESQALTVALGSIHRLRWREGRWHLEAGNLIGHLGEHYIES